MLLPVETFRDESTNTVYTTTDRMGTYCLVDMELWLNLLGIKPNNDNISQKAIDNFSALAYNGNNTESVNAANTFDVVFMVDQVNYSDEQLKVIQDSIAETSAAIWKRTPEATVVIYGYNGDGRTHFKKYGRSGAENSEALNAMLNRLVHVNSIGTVVLSKALDDLITESGISKNRIYCFAFFDSANDYTEALPSNSKDVLNDIHDGKYDINISVVSNIPEESKNNSEGKECYATALYNQTNGISIDANDFVEKSLKHIYGEKSNQFGAYNAIIATGYHTIVLDAPITIGYREAAEDVKKNPQNHERYKKSGMADTDKDGLLDFQEINFEIYGKDGLLVQFDEKGNIKELPLATVCSDLYVNTKGKEGEKPLTYVEKGWEAFEDSIYYSDLSKIHILPINSDPTSEDGDGDSVSDAEETMLNGKNPLILDNVRILYNEKITTENAVDQYLANIHKSIGYKEIVACLMEDYYDSDSKVGVQNISDKWWKVYCTRFNEYVQLAYPCFSNLITESTPKRFVPIPPEVHYFRNNLNRAPNTLEDFLKELNSQKNWILLPIGESRFHMYGEDGEYNVKFVSDDYYQMYEVNMMIIIIVS